MNTIQPIITLHKYNYDACYDIYKMTFVNLMALVSWLLLPLDFVLDTVVLVAVTVCGLLVVCWRFVSFICSFAIYSLILYLLCRYGWL